MNPFVDDEESSIQFGARRRTIAGDQPLFSEVLELAESDIAKNLAEVRAVERASADEYNALLRITG